VTEEQLKEALVKVILVLAVAAMLLIIGALLPVGLTVKISWLALTGVVIGAGAIAWALSALILWWTAPRKTYCLYRITAVSCSHPDEPQQRWKVGQQLCAKCPEDEPCVEEAEISVWNIPPNTKPSSTSPKCTVTLQLVNPECGACPDGVHIIGPVEPQD